MIRLSERVARYVFRGTQAPPGTFPAHTVTFRLTRLHGWGLTPARAFCFAENAGLT